MFLYQWEAFPKWNLFLPSPQKTTRNNSCSPQIERSCPLKRFSHYIAIIAGQQHPGASCPPELGDITSLCHRVTPAQVRPQLSDWLNFSTIQRCEWVGGPNACSLLLVAMSNTPCCLPPRPTPGHPVCLLLFQSQLTQDVLPATWPQGQKYAWENISNPHQLYPTKSRTKARRPYIYYTDLERYFMLPLTPSKVPYIWPSTRG